jgi:hypothetical protein
LPCVGAVTFDDFRDGVLAGRQMTDWPRALLFRKPRKLVAVALANKMARMAWAMMKSGETIAARPPPARWHHDRLDRFAAQALRNNWEWTHAPSIDR